MKTLGRSVAVAALTASAVTVGAATAVAEAPAAPAAQVQQFTTSHDTAAQSVTAKVDSGRFVNNAAAHSVDILDAAGKAVESIPLTIQGTAVPVAASVSQDGSALTLHKVSTTDTANKLWGQWLWGVNHGGAGGAIIGALIGCFFFFVGCFVGAGIGGAIASPNSGDINRTFNDLIAGR